MYLQANISHNRSRQIYKSVLASEMFLVISILKKAMRFRPISTDSLQSLACTGCYLFSTEVQLVSKWICGFFSIFFILAGMSKKAKNQVLTTHSECNNFVCVINQTFCLLLFFFANGIIFRNRTKKSDFFF